MKVIILGSRAGTSTMARLLEVAGKLLCDENDTEPPGLKELILDNLDTPEYLKDYFAYYDDWEVIKCPELAFVLPWINDRFPDAKYIYMYRHLPDRMESLKYLGWDKVVYERVMENPKLKKICVSNVFKKQDELALSYLSKIDLNVRYLFNDLPDERKHTVGYNTMNKDFEKTMMEVSDFLDLDYEKYIVTWKILKRVKNQGGRWLPSNK